MNMTRKFAVAGATILSLVGLGAGTAVAKGNPPAIVGPGWPRRRRSGPRATPSRFDQTVADQAPSGATESVDSVSEAAGTEQPGDVALPGGGHADPAGQSVDHQFQGVE